MMATEEFYEATKGRAELLTVYRFPESAARALHQLARYAEWRRTPDEAPLPPFPTDDAAVAALLDRAGEGYLSPEDTFRVLDLYGIPLARWQRVSTAEEALAAARELGYPVVVKAVAPDLVHKSDVGAVRVDLRSDGDLQAALADVEAKVSAAGHRVEGYVVQEMVRGGHEVIFGISTDPRFGPLLMFGLGGKYVEVLQDVRFAVPPLGRREAEEMIQGIRGIALLRGVRGEAAADFEILTDVLLRLAQLAQRHPRIQELDVNPFLASSDRAQAKALDARIRVG
jgi:acyl-CoA synthetase (NDP forming)